MTRFALLLASAFLGAESGFADAPHPRRIPDKEPVYETKAPKYGLLRFGPEGKDQVWLVLDGNTLYVDRNGNGDLTEAGEKILPEKSRAGSDPEQDGVSFEVGELAIGAQRHKGLRVHSVPLKYYSDVPTGSRPEAKALLAKDRKARVARINVEVAMQGFQGGGVDGRIIFAAGPDDADGVLHFADRPAEAPIIHCGGPLQITFFGERPTLRAGREPEVYLVVGSPGVGPGTFAMLPYHSTIPDEAKPVAEITYPPAQLGAAPMREKIELKSRC